MARSQHNRIAVMHGANLNTLGRRDPAHYGTDSLSALEQKITGWAHELGLEPRFMQTNDERELIEHLQELDDVVDGGILNAGAWTHYSYALRDALEVSGVPVVEVHLSDIQGREQWRQASVFDGLVLAQISGEGPDGYRRALELLAQELEVAG